MSTTHPVTLPDGTLKTVRKLTYREARYVQERLKAEDCSRAEAARRAGFPQWMLHEVNRCIEVGEVAALIQELQSTLAEHAVEASLIDAVEIHEYLTDAIRADWCDIENDDGTFKPISQWPSIWRRMKEKGDIEVTTLSERSHDEATKDKAGGWDQVGYVTKVKVAFSSRVKLLELAMKHVAVKAMADTRVQIDEHIHVTIEDKLQRARSLASGAVIDVVPE